LYHRGEGTARSGSIERLNAAGRTRASALEGAGARDRRGRCLALSGHEAPLALFGLSATFAVAWISMLPAQAVATVTGVCASASIEAVNLTNGRVPSG
jgi:hypothetical protein